MKYFTNCRTLDELKAEYRRLCMKHHPDRGGDTATMQEINDEHDRVFELLKAKQNAAADADKTGRTQRTTETAEEFRDILTKLLKLEGVTVELCGRWLWISGDTHKNREALRTAGCRWSSGKKMWYWRHNEDGNRWHKGTRSIDEIRCKYGSQVFAADGGETYSAGNRTGRIGATA